MLYLQHGGYFHSAVPLFRQYTKSTSLTLLGKLTYLSCTSVKKRFLSKLETSTPAL